MVLKLVVVMVVILVAVEIGCGITNPTGVCRIVADSSLVVVVVLTVLLALLTIMLAIQVMVL